MATLVVYVNNCVRDNVEDQKDPFLCTLEKKLIGFADMSETNPRKFQLFE